MIPIFLFPGENSPRYAKLLLFVLLIVVSAVAPAQSQNGGAEPGPAAFVSGKIYVKFKPGFKPAQFPVTVNGMGDAEKRLVNLGGEVATFGISKIEKTYKVLSARRPGLSDFYTITFSDDTRKADLIRVLAARTEIELAEKVPVIRTSCPPNDPDFAIPARNWHLLAVGAPAIWCNLDGCAGSVIAVVDDAVRTTHEDLVSKVVGQYDVTDGTFDANPPASATNSFFTHGTHVAGIAAGATNNGVGIASIGYNCTLYAIKTAADNSPDPSILDMPYEGVEWAIDQGVDIINMSWGGGGYSATHQALFDEAFNLNIICVAAAGNNNDPFANYPAAYEHVIGVGAAAPGNVRACFSNYGAGVDISAPGANIWSTLAGANNAYGFLSGTSMASPMVAGIAGLIRCANPTINPDQLALCMINTAVPMNYDFNCNPSVLYEEMINIPNLAACDYSGYGNCPPEECELVWNRRFEVFDATSPDVNDLGELLCQWQNANSTPFVCDQGGNHRLGLFLYPNDNERLVSENQLALTTGQAYIVEFDYWIANDSPDELLLCLTADNAFGPISGVAHTNIGVVSNPAVDVTNVLNNQCPPASTLTWHHFTGGFTYSGDGRRYLNVTGNNNTAGSPPLSFCLAWIDNISIRPDIDLTVAADDSLLNCGGCTRLHAYTNLVNAVITWTPTTGLDNPNSAHPLACPDETTTYTATVFDPVTKCSANASVTVEVDAPYWDLQCYANDGYFCVVNQYGGSHVMQWITPFTGSMGHCQSTAGLNYGDPLVFVIYTYDQYGVACADTIKTVYTCRECELSIRARPGLCTWVEGHLVYYVSLEVTGTFGECWMVKQKYDNGTEVLLGTFSGDQAVFLGPFDPALGDWTLWVFLCEGNMDCVQDVFIDAPSCKETPRSTDSGDSGYRLYPSPVVSNLIIDDLNPKQMGGTTEATFMVFDILGKPVVRTTLPAADTYKLNLEDLNTGVYLLGTVEGGTIRFVGKFIKQ